MDLVNRPRLLPPHSFPERYEQYFSFSAVKALQMSNQQTNNCRTTLHDTQSYGDRTYSSVQTVSNSRDAHTSSFQTLISAPSNWSSTPYRSTLF
jgi:hypothetical protein